MTVADLHRVLGTAGIGLTPDEIADALWLAVLMPERASGWPRTPGSAVTPDTREPGPLVQAAHAPRFRPDNDDTAAEAEVSLHLPGASRRESAPAFPGQAVRVPTDRGLADQLGLARALRPLRRQLASGRHVVLDEAATADHSAERRTCWPVYVPAAERVIDVALVVDTSTSMALWHSMISDLRLLCERLGVFRDVRVRYLAADETSDPPRPVLRGESPISSEREPQELLDPSGRRLILVVTDGVHPYWRAGLFSEALALWASAGSVAIIQPLPQRLWDRTGLRSVVATFHAAGAVDRGRLMHPQQQPTSDQPSGVRAIPLLELTPASLARWAKLAVGIGPGIVSAAAVLVHADSADGNGQRPDAPADGRGRTPADPATRVRDFRASVSPAAYRLAGLFSAVAPLNLPVMRLVQEIMGTDTGLAELAEVFLSGLLRRVTPPDDPEAQYDFVDGIREVLLSTITRAQAVDLLRLTGAHLTGRHDSGRSFAAVAITAGAEDIRDAAAVHPAFANVAKMVLDRLAPSGTPAPPRSTTTSIGKQIAAALADRSSQREFVGALARNWEQLGDSWTHLVTSAAELAAGGDWRRRAASVSAAMAEASELVRTLHRRVFRETVNIAVAGQVGAGKSTLLRKLTGLSDEVIPSNRFSSTTAAPSRIFHEPGARPGRAVLFLHTWESFRTEVLESLHQQAGIPGPAPSSVEEFRRFLGYRDDRAVTAADRVRYRKRLRLAQDSLPSYQDLLQGGTLQITLDQLRPFVAYPEDEDLRPGYRPYHAVRSVDIFCEFPEIGIVALGLVDMPGVGEAGLDVHGRFLANLRNEADLLFIVKRPDRMSYIIGLDWDMFRLTEDAAAGARRSDFVYQIINLDARLPREVLDTALAQARTDAEQLGIQVRACDIQASPAEVTQAVLAPALALLTERLAAMDRDVAGRVLSDVAEVASQTQSLAGEMTRLVERLLGDLPDQEKRRIRVLNLKNQVGRELEQVRDKYIRQYASGESMAEVDFQIEIAGRGMREWLAAHLGTGSEPGWLRTFQEAAAHDLGRELDRRYRAARDRAVAEFGQVDAALQLSVERMWGEVADALRRPLTQAVVPAGPDNRAILAAFMDTSRIQQARTLAKATEGLLSLPNHCGSIFLRAGRPVISKLRWELAASAPQPVTASGWLTRLESAVEQVTSQLELELRAEGRGMLRILATAVDQFKEAVTETPGIEVEYERLCSPVQRKIWPEDFPAATAEPVASLAALRQRAAEADAAARQVASLATRAWRP